MARAILENVAKIFQYGYQARIEGGRNELCWQVKVVDLVSLRWGDYKTGEKVDKVLKQHELFLDYLEKRPVATLEMSELGVATSEKAIEDVFADGVTYAPLDDGTLP